MVKDICGGTLRSWDIASHWFSIGSWHCDESHTALRFFPTIPFSMTCFYMLYSISTLFLVAFLSAQRLQCWRLCADRECRCCQHWSGESLQSTETQVLGVFQACSRHILSRWESTFECKFNLVEFGLSKTDWHSTSHTCSDHLIASSRVTACGPANVLIPVSWMVLRYFAVTVVHRALQRANPRKTSNQSWWTVCSIADVCDLWKTGWNHPATSSGMLNPQLEFLWCEVQSHLFGLWRCWKVQVLDPLAAWRHVMCFMWMRSSDDTYGVTLIVNGNFYCSKTKR